MTGAQITFTFHRPIVVGSGPPVTITDAATHSADYYTGWFDYSISPDGLTLVLTQTGGVLPNKMWLETALTSETLDATTGFAAVPFTQYVYTLQLPGNCDGDGDIDIDDFETFGACMAGPDQDPGQQCGCDDCDCDADADLADFDQLQAAFTGALPS